MINPDNKPQLAKLLDNSYKPLVKFGEDIVTTSDVQTLIEANGIGYVSIPEINTLLEDNGFVGETIKPTAEKLWRVEIK